MIVILTGSGIKNVMFRQALIHNLSFSDATNNLCSSKQGLRNILETQKLLQLLIFLVEEQLSGNEKFFI